MTEPKVRREDDRGVTRITLAAPERRNALSKLLVGELRSIIQAVAQDPEVRVVVLAADGPAFCAGGDLSEASEGGTQGPGEALLALLRSLLELPQPVVGRIHAPVRAGGIGLVGACDLAIGVPRATFAFTEARLGLTPAIISLTTLPLLSARAASDLYLTGRTIDGEEAAEQGLLTRCVAEEELDAVVAELAAALRETAPQGLAETKQLLLGDRVRKLVQEGPALVDLSVRLFGSEQAQEGIRAFLERRSPSWQSSDTEP